MPATYYSKAEYDDIADQLSRVTKQYLALEQMRPVWAQGYGSESQAAQASAGALAVLWQMLDVDSQSDAVQALRALLAKPADKLQYEQNHFLWVDYTNYKGSRAWRRVVPLGMECAVLPQHGTEPQWFMHVLMEDRDMARRSLCMKDIHKIGTSPLSYGAR